MLLINPDNPTGAVYPRDVLEKMVDIARRYRIFVICDEIYAHIVYNGAQTLHLSEVIGDVPGMALRGISKEFPWPGARCGWIEVFNQDVFPMFKTYLKTVKDSKMVEVCSTTLPQLAIPRIIGDPRYIDHLQQRERIFEKRAKEAVRIFSEAHPSLIHPIVEPRGAFYMSVLFQDNVLNDRQTLPIANPDVRAYIEEKVKDVEVDKRFVYYLLGATGICVVPLTGFCCDRKGFRMTLLETDDKKRRWTWKTIVDSINRYAASA
jgi:aspartate/methionine/tyrosine aminotransferase